MKQVDVVVIGGDILGCVDARNLRRWNISVLMLEEKEDVCTGITRANSAIVYSGYDNRPGTMKAKMTVQGNKDMDRLCRQLDVDFHRCGSLLVCYDQQSARRLERKYQHGLQSGVPGLRLLPGAQAEEMEPMLKPGVVSALYAPTTGTVNPWQLGIAAYENARSNGVQVALRTKVLAIRKDSDTYTVETTGPSVRCKMILNCAGLYADRVQNLLCPGNVRLHWDGADYLVLDPQVDKPSRIIFHQAQSCGKGITAIPCTEGNLLLSGVRRPVTEPFATTYAGLQDLLADAKALFPDLDLQVIRSFGAVRPNPITVCGDSLPDFCIENPSPGFYSLIGIKTPGLTCANVLGAYLAERAADYLHAGENPQFDPCRQRIVRSSTLPEEELHRLIQQDPNYGQILCQCGHITTAEVLQAIARGAVSADGVKRRIGTAMGPCQGGRCQWRIEEVLKQSGVDPILNEVSYD